MMWMVIAVAVAAGAPRASGSCEGLTSRSLPDVAIARARTVEAGQFTSPGGRTGRGGESPYADVPAFCRVEMTAAPSRDSAIHIEVWLPTSGWNGKFLGVGNGAWGGSVPFPAMAAGVQRGYATVGTDTGHDGTSASFAMGHPEKLIDFAYRAVHEMTVKGKAIAAAFYGRAPRLSYFNGCSTGGRQALAEAQRFADDFDGIVAGAPGNDTTHQAFGQVWIAQAAQKNASSTLPPEKLAVVHAAAIAACDANDGVRDGVLEDPTRCAFDPKALLCPAGDAPSCLTAPQVDAVRSIYAGARHPRTGTPIFPGLERGGELGWGRWLGAQPADYATDFFKYVVYADPAWDFRALDFDADLATAESAGKPLDATDADLTTFVGHGGKLLLYAGWSDPGIAPRNVVNYYRRVQSTMGEPAVRDAVRLFMVPGMAHCGGGDGTSTMDLLGTIDAWVDKHATPSRIDAARLSRGAADRTRPLCPYPQVATYAGSGSTDAAANFVCR